MGAKDTTTSITLATLARMKQAGDRIACLTAYDASFAALLEQAGVEVLLVGDSLGMVVQGQSSTIPVSIAEMVYHTHCVARASGRALVVADMPFMSYATTEQALGNAARLMRKGGAHVVKLEGGAERIATISALTEQGIPVCAHLGLLPQSVHKLGGYRVQGRAPEAAMRLREEAVAVQEAGAGMLILECVPSELAREITASLHIPVIGIGAGADCDGQVLVLYDLLGITQGPRPRFVRNFVAGHQGIADAVRAYVGAVKTGTFPSAEESYR